MTNPHPRKLVEKRTTCASEWNMILQRPWLLSGCVDTLMKNDKQCKADIYNVELAQPYEGSND